MMLVVRTHVISQRRTRARRGRRGQRGEGAAGAEGEGAGEEGRIYGLGWRELLPYPHEGGKRCIKL